MMRPRRNRDAQVGAHGAEPRHGALAHEAERQPALEEKHIGGPEPEHHRRMAIEPVNQAAASVQRKILPHRLRLDVADAAPVEISGRCVVDRVAAPPEVVGRQGQDADRPADPVVGGLARQERSVPAIVLDHEQADEQPGGERRQREREPVKAMLRGEQHRGPERGKGREGDQELKHGATRVRASIGGERLRPLARRPRRACRFRQRHVLKTPPDAPLQGKRRRTAGRLRVSEGFWG